jgi:hypothetical protein
MANKLCSDAKRMSCQCLLKYTAKMWLSSGFLTYGRAVYKFHKFKFTISVCLVVNKPNQSFHSGCPCNSVAILLKNSRTLSVLLFETAFTK